MRLSYYCTSSWANYFSESLSGSTCFHFVMRPIVHVSWEEPLSIAAVVRKSIQKVLFNISIKKKMCVYPHPCHTVPTAGLLICVVLLLWIFFQIQFHGDEDAGMTVVLGLVILQWYIPLTLTRVPQHQLLFPPIQFSSKSPLVFYLYVF